MRLFDLDESEREESPYRYGDGSCMFDIIPIEKEKAESIVGSSIDLEEIRKSIYNK